MARGRGRVRLDERRTLEFALRQIEDQFSPSARLHEAQGHVTEAEAVGDFDRFAEAYRLMELATSAQALERDAVAALGVFEDRKPGSKAEARERDAFYRRHIDAIANFLLKTKMTGKYDGHGALVTVIAPRSQEEMQLFARDLLKAYGGFANLHRFGLEELEQDGSSHPMLKITGEDAYGLLRGEHGVHRVLTRDRRGSRHRGSVSVVVAPYVEGEELRIPPTEFNTTYFAASSNGGQHANTSNTNVRIVHIPTKIEVVRMGRSQADNLKLARMEIYSRVAQYLEEQKEPVGERPVVSNGSNHFRVYTLSGEAHIKEQRIGHETRDTEAFFRGGIDPFIRLFYRLGFY